MSGKEYMEEIIYRHLNREASPQEENELRAWLLENPANQQEYEGLLEIWNEAGKLAAAIEFDKNAAWLAIHNKITSARPKRLNPGIYRVAASIILIGLLSALIYFIARPGKRTGETIQALKGNQKIDLPDGSIVLLRKGGSLHYETDYAENKRNLQLTGEAFFQVRHDPQKPFIVKTSRILVEDLGTSFLVSSLAGEDRVFVKEGRLKIMESRDSSHAILLGAGQSLRVIGKEFDKDSIADNNYLSWQTGVLQFDNSSLKNMINGLNHHFQVHIYMSEALAAKSDSIKVNFRFEKSSLEQALEEIHLATGLITERNQDSIFLHEK